MDKLLDTIMDFVLKNKDIDNDEAEVVRYGLEMFILKAVFSLAALAVGALMHSFWECLVFIILFSAIRSYAGGYHADTRIQCFIQSVLTFVAVFTVLKVYTDFMPQLIVSSVVFAISLWFFSPIDTENRRLSDEECRKFRNKTRLVLCIEAVIAVVSHFLNFGSISCAVMLAVITSGVLMSVGYIKEENNEKSNEK